MSPSGVHRLERTAGHHAVEDDCRQWHARYMNDRTRLIAIADRMGVVKPHAVSVTRRAAS
jgi:hypothetical protein